MKVAVSGYFCPIHRGHIALFKRARELGDELVVIINNDGQTINKNGYVFMPVIERADIIKELRCVDDVVISIDTDQTVCETLKLINPDIFANGGDRVKGNVPEEAVCNLLDIKMIYGVVGVLGSSRDIVNNAYENIKRLKL